MAGGAEAWRLRQFQPDEIVGIAERRPGRLKGTFYLAEIERVEKVPLRREVAVTRVLLERKMPSMVTPRSGERLTFDTQHGRPAIELARRDDPQGRRVSPALIASGHGAGKLQMPPLVMQVHPCRRHREAPDEWWTSASAFGAHCPVSAILCVASQMPLGVPQLEAADLEWRPREAPVEQNPDTSHVAECAGAAPGRIAN